MRKEGPDMLAKVRRVDAHHFQYDVHGMHGEIDVTLEKPAGSNPKEYLLAALCACIGTDVVDL